MNTKVKTRAGGDAIIIDMNGPDPDWPIAAWVQDSRECWNVEKYARDGRYLKDSKVDDDLMLTTYRYRIEYPGETRAYWWPAIGALPVGLKVSRGTFNMDGDLIDICLMTEAQIAELKVD
jgi:hypothetical protein